MPFTLDLDVSEAQYIRNDRANAIRLRFEATSPVGSDSDPNVFLFGRSAYNPHKEAYTDTFLKVCGPDDMATYPIDEPNSNTPYRFFRSSYVELDFASLALANQTETDIAKDFTGHIAAMRALEAFSTTRSYRFGDDVETSESASESNSN